MADEAHKEPTMEEILSSIRKIISEDEAPVEETAAPSPEVEDIAVASAVNDDFEDVVSEDVAGFAFDDDLEEEDIFESDTEFSDDVAFEEEPAFEAAADLEADSFEETPEIEAEAEAAPEPAPVEEPEPVAAAPAPQPVAAAPTPTPSPASQETAVTQPVNIRDSALTDDSTADAAAGALGKLISNMDLGGDNTIEGLVREMLKPMIKDWLDTNLQGIVESKVEAEVARIARMAR